MSAEGARKLFVGGISETVTEQELRTVFEGAGFTVAHLALPRDRESGRLRGFAFVTLASEDEAVQARARLQGVDCGGRPLSLREFSQEPPKRGAPGERMERGERPPRQELPTVFMGKLPFEATQPDIQALFDEYEIGQITKLVLPIGPDGRPRGFGFASLETEDQVRLAVAKLNGATLMGRNIVVSPAQAKGAPGGGGGRRERNDDGPRRPGPSGGARFDRGADAPQQGYDPFYPPEMPVFPPPAEGKGAGRRREGKKEKKEKRRGSTGGGDSMPRGSRKGRGGGGNWHRWEEDDD